MDRLRSMEIFLAVADAGSFTGAATRMSLPRSSVTRAIKALEAHLGVELIRRSTRRFGLTEEGTLYLDRARRIIAEMAELEGMIGNPSAAQGTVRVNTTALIAERLLVPLLPRFHEDHPGISLRLSTGDALVDVIGSGLDCVIRAGSPGDSPRITARKLGEMSWGIYAAPRYLEMFGEPQTMEDLRQHSFVGYNGGGRDFLRMPHADGEIRLGAVPWLTLGDTGTYIEAGIQGIGLIRAADLLVEAHVAAGRLCRVLRDVPADRTPIHLIHGRAAFPSPALRAFRDWLVRSFPTSA